MKFFSNSRGATLIEFGLILPLFLALIFGLIEFGLFMYNQQVLTNAAREGARFGIVQGAPRKTQPEIQAVVRNYLKPLEPDGTEGPWRLITFNTVPNPVIQAPDTCNAGWDPVDYARVTVSISTPYLVVDSMIQLASLSLIRLPPMTLSTESVMKCE